MYRVAMTVIKWASIPVLLVASILLSGLAARYGLLLDLLVCMGGIILVRRAVGRHRYVSGAGLAAVVVVFSPIFLVVKIFLLLGLTGIVACIALTTVFRTRRLQVAWRHK
jgi:hypothetical protein